MESDDNLLETQTSFLFSFWSTLIKCKQKLSVVESNQKYVCLLFLKYLYLYIIFNRYRHFEMNIFEIMYCTLHKKHMIFL